MHHWAPVTDFRFRVPDHPGSLAALAGRLRAADVNLLALRVPPPTPVGESPDPGAAGTVLVSCIPESAPQFRAFSESAGLDCEESSAFYVAGEDEVGALVRMLDEVAEAGINLVGLESVAFDTRYGTLVRTSPRDWERLSEVLGGEATRAPLARR